MTADSRARRRSRLLLLLAVVPLVPAACRAAGDPPHAAWVAPATSPAATTTVPPSAATTGSTGPRPTTARTATPPSGPPRHPELRPVSEWERLFLASWDKDNVDVYLPLSRSGNSWDYYNLAFGIDANTAMYRATGKLRYLDRSLAYVNNMIADAKVSSALRGSQWKDGYLGWPAWNHPYDKSINGGEYPLLESFVWRYVTELLQVINDDPALRTNPAYKRQYDRILGFTERNVFDKWYNRDDTRGGGRAGITHVYRQNMHMAAHWAFICMNLSAITASATRKAQCRTVADNINYHMPNFSGASLHGQLKLGTAAPGAYFWDENWNRSSRPGCDIPHANGIVAYVVEAHDRDVQGWTGADINALSRTLTDVIWRNYGTSYPMFLDGSGADGATIADGFMKLGRYDAAIQMKLEHYTGPISDNYKAVIQYYANGALNAKLLGAPP
jgi:hypothetical protein